MTKREMYTAVIEGKVTDEVIEGFKELVATLDKANEKRRAKKTEVQTEVDNQVLTVLTTEPVKAKAIADAIGLTTSKVVASCKRLAEEGKVVITEERKGSRITNSYALVADED